MKERLLRLAAISIISFLVVGFFTIRIKTPSRIPENAEIDQEMLESFYSNKAEYESADASVKNRSTRKVTAGIISHHFLAKDLIADFFAGIDSRDVEIVYLVGPDHFSVLTNGNQLAVSTLLNWQTPFGILNSDQSIISQLVANNLVTLDDHVFNNEHAIYTLVPFIKRSVPSVKIVPIVLATNLSDELAFKLGQKLVLEHAIIIVSSDFAHQVSEVEAKSLDEKSLVALNRPSLDTLDEITNDCRQCIALLVGYLSNQQATFELRSNKTSADFGPARKDDITSYISAFYRL